MAVTQIADIYEPLTFAAIIDERATELNAFHASGIISEDAVLTAQASAGGRIGELPNFGPLTQTAPNLSSDDPAVFSTPEKITDQKQRWRLAALNQSWSTMDLARELALSDPAMAITNKIAQYWATEKEKRVIQMSLGILADNIASDSGDMAVIIGTDAVLPVLASEIISAEAVIACQQTAGDHQRVFSIIAMHSVCYSNLKLLNLIEFIPDARGEVLIPFYLEMRVVVDDSMPAIAGSNRIIYTSILFGPGAVGHGKGVVVTPSELERIPSAGTGGGQEILYSRTSDIYHPWGMDFTSASVAADSASLAELTSSANWDRVYERKNIPMAFLQTNG